MPHVIFVTSRMTLHHTYVCHHCHLKYDFCPVMSVIARRRCPCVIFIAFTVTISTCHLCHLQGDIVSCTQSNIYLWTINGELLVKTAISKAAYSSITCCTMSEVGEEGGAVWSEVVRAVWSGMGAGSAWGR